MPAYKMFVLGDSVPWGQGLEPQEKFYNLVASKFRTDVAPDITVLAHSGAIIGASVASDASDTAVDGEVPWSYPTIMQQCDACGGNANDADMVIVNGGINDVTFPVIINPTTDPDDLRNLTVQYCYMDMKALLSKVAFVFPNPKTKIIVTGYFPILSQLSELDLLPVFLSFHGVAIPPFMLPMKDLAFGRPVANAQQYWKQSTSLLSQAANEVNGDIGKGRITFVSVPFKDENALFAPQSWLWGIDPDLTPLDPVQDARHASCDIYEKDLLQREICYRASTGHPNVTGAQQFSTAICAAFGK